MGRERQARLKREHVLPLPSFYPTTAGLGAAWLYTWWDARKSERAPRVLNLDSPGNYTFDGLVPWEPIGPRDRPKPPYEVSPRWPGREWLEGEFGRAYARGMIRQYQADLQAGGR